jgi:DNA-binding NarL/FixJ family response regulator
MTARVLIVDDHPIMLEGMRGLISGEPGLQLCGEANSAASAMTAVEQFNPDIVILDLFLGADDDLELVGRMHGRWPKLPILLVSMHDETLFAERLLAMGARGFVMKREATQLLLTAVRKVLDGEYFVSPALGNRLFSRKARTKRSASTPDALTEREREVLADIALGRSAKEIANRLNINVKTVDSHRRAMREKLGLASSADLARYAMQWARPHPASPAEDEAQQLAPE